MHQLRLQRRSLRSRWRLCRLTDAACPLRVVSALYGTMQRQEGAGAPPHHPDVSLRGAKRRGNLAEPDRTTGKSSAKSQLPSRDCHVGLRPPRNDNSGGHTIFTMACTGRECGAEPGCPFPCNDHTVRSASVTGTTLCRTASVVSICKPTRPPLKQTVSPSAIVASANVGNCFFMPMGLQPPWT